MPFAKKNLQPNPNWPAQLLWPPGVAKGAVTTLTAGTVAELPNWTFVKIWKKGIGHQHLALDGNLNIVASAFAELEREAWEQVLVALKQKTSVEIPDLPESRQAVRNRQIAAKAVAARRANAAS